MIMRWEDIPGPFLGNNSVNTFLQQQTQTQHWNSNRGMMFSVVTNPDTATEELFSM
jgi:hypothetical protein